MQPALTLTDQQQRIVAHNHGPALVFAVAGAGKTTAMIHRVERLVRERVFAPERILVSSFNKSAVEDIGRAMAPWPHCRAVPRRTLHALGYRIVQEAARRGLFPRLADDALKTGGEERQLIWAARDLARQRGLVAAYDLDGLDEQDLLNYIGACKGNLCYADLAGANLPASALAVARQAETPPGLPWYLELYKLHEELRRERGWLTFDDMLLLGWEALVRSPELLAAWQGRFDAVIVDEFQDVNLAQSEILDLITAPDRNYMAIGDDDQTIYGFRGASMGFFRAFARRYDAAVYEMTDNFRCQASQVLLANRVIAQNRERHPKALVVTQGFGGATLLRRAPDAAAIGRLAAEDILAARRDGFADHEIAVLVRLTAQTPAIEQALIAAGVPYRIAGDEPFFRRREITDLLRYAELAALDAELRRGRRLDPAQAERFGACWRSLYNRPKRYLSRQLFQESLDAVRRQGRPLSEVLVDLAEQVSERVGMLLHSLSDLLRWLAEAQHSEPADALLSELDRRLGFQEFLRQNSGFPETGAGYAENVAAFIQYARGRGRLADLVAHLAELEATRAAAERAAPEAGVDIRTIHRAKGLEWPVVLVPNCNAGTIPFSGNADQEEERRLLYVAITRARSRLLLYTASDGAQPSPFLSAARADATIERAAELGRLLDSDPATWTAAETLSVAAFPREFGQERFFTHWWGADAAARERVAARVLALVAAARRGDGLGQLGLSAADLDFWTALAPAAAATPAAAFAGLDALLARGRAAPRASGRKGDPEPPDYRVGERVRHPVFGDGLVVDIRPGTANRRREWYITVEFRSRGLVKLLADIAPLARLRP